MSGLENDAGWHPIAGLHLSDTESQEGNGRNRKNSCKRIRGCIFPAKDYGAATGRGSRNKIIVSHANDDGGDYGHSCCACMYDHAHISYQAACKKLSVAGFGCKQIIGN